MDAAVGLAETVGRFLATVQVRYMSKGDGLPPPKSGAGVRFGTSKCNTRARILQFPARRIDVPHTGADHGNKYRLGRSARAWQVSPTSRQGTHDAGAVDMRAENDEEAPDIASSSERYAQRFAGPSGRYLLDRQSTGIARLLRSTGASGAFSVLDVGGGHMQTAPLLSGMGHSVTVHASSTDCLGRMPSSAAPGLDSRIGSMLHLPAADEEFDLVLSIRMLGHVGRWRDFLGELCRVSRRYVIIEFASASGAQRFGRSFFGLKRRLEGNTRHYSTYAVSEIEGELRRRGFVLLAMERQFALPILIHRVLQRPAVSRLLENVLGRAGVTRRIGGPVLLLAERRERSASS